MLKLLGISLTPNPTLLNIVAGVIKTKLSVGMKRVEDLANLPEMTDPNKQAIMRISSGIVSSAVQTKPQLLPLLTFMMIQQCVKYGNSLMCVLPSFILVLFCAGYGLSILDTNLANCQLFC